MKLSDLKIEPDGSIAGQYLHGVDLNNDVLVHNLGIAGRLWTADYIGAVDPGIAVTHRAIGDIPIEDLPSFGLHGNVISPRCARYFIPAAILDMGQTIVNGHGIPWELSDGQRARITALRDMELAFERGRRQFAPDVPSRLSCIWLAESNDTGRSVIRSIFPKAYIAHVRVLRCTAIAMADMTWFDDYYNIAKPEFIKNYWMGKAHPTTPRPEVLVNGVIDFTDPEQLMHIRKHGARLGQG